MGHRDLASFLDEGFVQNQLETWQSGLGNQWWTCRAASRSVGLATTLRRGGKEVRVGGGRC